MLVSSPHNRCRRWDCKIRLVEAIYRLLHRLSYVSIRTQNIRIAGLSTWPLCSICLYATILASSCFCCPLTDFQILLQYSVRWFADGQLWSDRLAALSCSVSGLSRLRVGRDSRQWPTNKRNFPTYWRRVVAFWKMPLRLRLGKYKNTNNKRWSRGCCLFMRRNNRYQRTVVYSRVLITDDHVYFCVAITGHQELLFIHELSSLLIRGTAVYSRVV
jgi:hypothetical protein